MAVEVVPHPAELRGSVCKTLQNFRIEVPSTELPQRDHETAWSVAAAPD